MKQQDFKWMLSGCHPLSDVAMAYFSDYTYVFSAVRTFRKKLRDIPGLWQELQEAGYVHKTIVLTPRQITIIIRYWGMPPWQKRRWRNIRT